VQFVAGAAGTTEEVTFCEYILPVFYWKLNALHNVMAASRHCTSVETI